MLTTDQIARLAHEVNRGYCLSIGDTSQAPWEGAPDWQKASARKGVEFHLFADHTPEESHQAWVNEKIEQGWQYGLVKSEGLKEHPCLLPYAELPQAQRTKDYLFRAVVHACRPEK